MSVFCSVATQTPGLSPPQILSVGFWEDSAMTPSTKACAWLESPSHDRDPPPRRDLAIDVVSYSRLMGEDETGTVLSVREHETAVATGRSPPIPVIRIAAIVRYKVPFRIRPVSQLILHIWRRVSASCPIGPRSYLVRRRKVGSVELYSLHRVCTIYVLQHISDNSQ